MKSLRLPDGRERVVRHGHGPERWCRPGSARSRCARSNCATAAPAKMRPNASASPRRSCRAGPGARAVSMPCCPSSTCAASPWATLGGPLFRVDHLAAGHPLAQAPVHKPQVPGSRRPARAPSSWIKLARIDQGPALWIGSVEGPPFGLRVPGPSSCIRWRLLTHPAALAVRARLVRRLGQRAVAQAECSRGVRALRAQRTDRRVLGDDVKKRLAPPGHHPPWPKRTASRSLGHLRRARWGANLASALRYWEFWIVHELVTVPG